MRVNAAKTAMLCVSNALSFQAEAYIEDNEGITIFSDGTGRIKVLGFHFGKRPSVHEHIKVLRSRFLQRSWVLLHL